VYILFWPVFVLPDFSIHPQDTPCQITEIGQKTKISLEGPTLELNIKNPFYQIFTAKNEEDLVENKQNG
jgi:hypothetical protein